jgi:isoamylase
MPAYPDRLLPGRPYPLGAHWDGLGANFAVFSAHAEKIELCLFDPKGRREVTRLALPEYTDEVWHGYLPDAQPGLLYGYRAHGPFDPQRGHRFNPHKLLLDPYARKVAGPLRWSDALMGYRIHAGRSDLTFDRRDSGSAMMKAMLIDESFNWGDDRPPDVPWSKTVIYEAHVRGLSMQRQDLQGNLRGTCAALADPWFIDYLHRLGVTTLELLPVHAFVNERFLVERGLRNYWGYNTLAFCAPEPSYLSAGMTNELRVAIRKLHAAGIEVILDVVYNHTCEGNELGPTLSWRGLDNASYYRLLPGNERFYVNDTGCGNTLDLSHPRVLQMVMDSLRYWATSYHVDGFRFDLSSALGREAQGGFDAGSGFFDAIRQDPVLSQMKLIAEPWDCGPDGYRLGQHPPGFAEWNDRYRDGVRRFWRGDGGQRADLAARLAGSSDLFDQRGRRPWVSVNFITAHDGFTLRDLVSYAEKHNQANGDDNRDGHNENFSINCGVEGETDDPAVRAARTRLQRAMLATLFVSHGTPMLLAGDEFGRSQGGNNNAYCQDNEISWLDWRQAESEEGRALIDYVAQLLRIRHAHPVLRSDRFLHGREEPVPGIRDIEWFGPNGQELSPEDWHDPEGRALALRLAARDGGGVHIALILFNGDADDAVFDLPPPSEYWLLLVDSNGAHLPGGADFSGRAVNEDRITVAGRSLVILVATRPTGEPQ